MLWTRFVEFAFDRCDVIGHGFYINAFAGE